MADQAAKKPDQLSGGQKQRVAVARALVNKPDVLLLDEPLAALDLKLRQKMLIELDLIHDEVGITFLYVTHDQAEAMSLSDRIAVMDGGRIEQIGTPAEIYESPRTSFVAAFIGDTNFLEGRVQDCPERDYCRIAIDGLAARSTASTTRPSSPDSRSPSASGRRRSTSPATGPRTKPCTTPSRPSSRTSSTSARTRSTGSGPAATASRSCASTTATSSTRSPSAGRTTSGSGGTPTTASCSTASGRRTKASWPCRRRASASPSMAAGAATGIRWKRTRGPAGATAAPSGSSPCPRSSGWGSSSSSRPCSSSSSPSGRPIPTAASAPAGPSTPSARWRRRATWPSPGGRSGSASSRRRSAWLLALPAGYTIARAPERWRNRLLMLVIDPVLDELPRPRLRLEVAPPSRRDDQEGPRSARARRTRPRPCSTIRRPSSWSWSTPSCRSPSCPSTRRRRSSTSGWSRPPATSGPARSRPSARSSCPASAGAS